MRRIIYAFLLLLALTACGDRTVHPQLEEPVWTLVKEKAAVLPDGATADLWSWRDFERTAYRLPDGTELLEVERAHGPANVYVGGAESLDQLGGKAQAAIGAYYEEQGLLYDLQTELERAYADYQECQTSGENFESYVASQEIVPTSSNDRIICFMTITTRSIRGHLVEELRLGAVFDRETGEKLETESLFTVPRDAVVERLLNEAPIYDGQLREEIQAAWDPKWLEFWPEALDVTFPRGTLPSQETAFSFGADYEDIRDILQNWAIPGQE